MIAVRISLCIVFAVALAACGGEEKKVSDSDESGGTGTSEATALTSTATEVATAGESGTSGDPLQCGDPSLFPGVSKACVADMDCALVYDQLDCCGSLKAIGVSKDSVEAFGQTEAMCVALFPGCGCAPDPTIAEDGHIQQDSDVIAVRCVDKLCQSEIPVAMPLQ